MVEVSVNGDLLHLEVKGLDRLWAFRRSLDVRIENIRSVKVIAGPAEMRKVERRLGLGIRAPGTELPGVISAGTFHYPGRGKAFIDVRHPVTSALHIELDGERFRNVIVDVEDPASAIELIEAARAKSASHRPEDPASPRR